MWKSLSERAHAIGSTAAALIVTVYGGVFLANMLGVNVLA